MMMRADRAGPERHWPTGAFEGIAAAGVMVFAAIEASGTTGQAIPANGGMAMI